MIISLKKLLVELLKENDPDETSPTPANQLSRESLTYYGNFILNALKGHNPDNYYAQHQKEIDVVAATLQNKFGPRTGTIIYRGIILDPSEVHNGMIKALPHIRFVSFTENKDVATAFADPKNPMAQFLIWRYPTFKGYLITKNNYDPKQLLYHHSWSRFLPMQQVFGADVHSLETQKEIILKPEPEYHVTPVESGASNNYWVGESIEEVSREDFAKHLQKIGQLSPIQIAMKSRIRSRIEYARTRKDHIARGKCIHDENDAYLYSNKVKSLLCKDCIETRYNPKQIKALFNRICPHCLTYKLYYIEKDKRMSTLCRVCDKIRVGKHF